MFRGPVWAIGMLMMLAKVVIPLIGYRAAGIQAFLDFSRTDIMT